MLYLASNIEDDYVYVEDHPIAEALHECADKSFAPCSEASRPDLLRNHRHHAHCAGADLWHCPAIVPWTCDPVALAGGCGDDADGLQLWTDGVSLSLRRLGLCVRGPGP